MAIGYRLVQSTRIGASQTLGTKVARPHFFPDLRIFLSRYDFKHLQRWGYPRESVTVERVIRNFKVVPALIAILGLVPNSYGEETTNTVAFQGRLTAPGGGILANGTYPMRFRIYANETGGDALWTEEQPAVSIVDGLSNTVLFGETPPPQDLFSLWGSLWLEVWLDVDRDGFGEGDVFNPRTALNAVPIAFYAKDAGALGGIPADQYAKADEIYTKAESDEQRTAQDEQIAQKADNASVEASQAAQDAEIALKADADAVDASQAAQDAQIALKANTDTVNAALADLEASMRAAMFQWQEIPAGPVQAQKNRGYTVNSADEVTITLPSSADLTVGDVVRVSGAGAGGWRLAGNVGQHVITQELKLRNSDPWVPRDSSREWYSLASSADGNKLVAAVSGGQLYISTDSGESWNPKDSARVWMSVASSADGTKLVAVVYGGQIYTSTDSGLTWTPRETDRNWSAVASSADGTKLVATVSSGQIYTSTDSGENWTPRESSAGWGAVASSSDGSRLIAINGSALYVSTDSGENWNQKGILRAWRSVAMSSDGLKIIAAVRDGQLYTSTDLGESWIARESNREWRAVASSVDGTRLLACVNEGPLYVSVDSGETWSPREYNREWFAVASSADGTKLLAAVRNGNLYTSTDTTELTSGLAGQQYSAVELQYIGNDTFLPLSSSGDLERF